MTQTNLTVCCVQGTMQFMAIDVLQNVIAYAKVQERQRRGIRTAPADQIQRGVKHDLESLVWVAEYAVYRRAYEKAKEFRGDDLRFNNIQDIMKREFGQVTAEKIKAQRVSTYSAAFGQDSGPDSIYGVVERPLHGIMRALLKKVQIQNMVPAHLLPDYAQYQMVIKDIGEQDEIPANAGTPMTCKRMEEVLNACLNAYSLK